MVAALLRERQAEMGWTLDEIATRTGLARTTVHRALKGDTALAVEVLIPLALGMNVDLARLMRKASSAVDGA